MILMFVCFFLSILNPLLKRLLHHRSVLRIAHAANIRHRYSLILEKIQQQKRSLGVGLFSFHQSKKSVLREQKTSFEKEKISFEKLEDEF